MVWDLMPTVYPWVGETGKNEVLHHQKISTTKTLPSSKSLEDPSQLKVPNKTPLM
jgi:hypothetical protein